MTLTSSHPPIRERGWLGGRPTGRKCGDVDENLSDHGKGIWPIADLYCSSRTLNVRATQIISPHEIKVSEGGSERNFD